MVSDLSGSPVQFEIICDMLISVALCGKSILLLLRYVRVFAIANPPVVCNVRAPYSAG